MYPRQSFASPIQDPCGTMPASDFIASERQPMTSLLSLSGVIDKISILVGKITMWLILACTLISAGNAIVRKAFDISSNAMLEIQWYLFAAVFMVGAGYTFLKNAHVRIDFISSKLTARMRNWIDVVGIVIVLFPMCILCIWLSWPLFTGALASGEMSQNAGGLIRWPAYLMIPLGFAMLMVQGVSELIKRLAYLKGLIEDPLAHHESDDEKLAHELEQETAKRLGTQS
jgi:TRAP-type mannitol/chloroaromatic compound transport system permease small subunit